MKGATMRSVPIILLAVVLLALPACGSKKNPTRSDRAAELVAQGWQRFAAEDYSGALEKFEEALGELSEYPEALTGKGWALAFLGDFPEARLALVAAKERRGRDPDIWAGGAFVYAALGDYDQVVLWAESALGLNATWEFSRRTSINHRHIRYVLAVAYWYRGSYHQCRQQLDILEPGVVHDPDPQSLLADLQRLFISPFS